MERGRPSDSTQYSHNILDAAAQVTTVPRPNRVPLKPLTASECFPIDCTNDVVEGDTILFTERFVTL